MASGFRLRVRYGKTGRLRWLSHLEVMRALERTVRRAALPYAVSRGFSPKMKMALSPALPTGTAGDHEYVDVWLTAFVPTADVLARLRAAAPEDLAPQAVGYVLDSEPSLSVVLTLATYETVVDGGPDVAVLTEALAAVVSRGTLSVDNKGKVKAFDLPAVLAAVPTVATAPDGRVLVSLTIRIGLEGSLRPEALIRAALDEAGGPEGRLTTTRTGLSTPGDGGAVVPPSV